jgi:glycosyltransferase involved in cell wall biosynthesis
VLWSPANSGPLAVSNQIATIQDISPLEHPEWFRMDFAAWYRLFLPLLVKRVRQVLVSSQYIKRKIETRLGVKNVLVTSAGVNGKFFHPDAFLDKYELPEKYILFLGSLEPRKNLPALIEAWNKISEEFSNTWLIVAGDTGRVFQNVKFPPFSKRTSFLGYIPDAALPGLYAKATLFILPSLEEGFGLPVLEAMSCGTPVISSSAGALPEIVGNAAMLVNPHQVDEMSEAMRTLLSSKSLRNDLKQRGLKHVVDFTWERSADRIWDALSNEV